jgi:hypothetical protein
VTVTENGMSVYYHQSAEEALASVSATSVAIYGGLGSAIGDKMGNETSKVSANAIYHDGAELASESAS